MDKNDRCYICGSRENLTKEHVPPKGLFPVPRPNNLIKVPGCEPCNNGKSQDDEYFRLAMAAFRDRSPDGDRIWNEKVLNSTLPKGRIARRISEIIQDSELVSSNASGDSSLMAFDPEVLDRMVVKIVRGLLYKSRPSIDSSLLDFDVTLIDQFRLEETIPVVEKMRRWDIGDSVFRFWRGLAVEDERAGQWVLLFYDACMWSVIHTPRDHSPTKARNQE